MKQSCVSCGGPVGEERWEIGFRYCMKPDCVRVNRRGLVLLYIGQNKTNDVIDVVNEDTLRKMREGKFRRDPVVVGRQPSRNLGKVWMRAKPAPRECVDRARVRFVQALQAQGLSVSDIVRRGAYMGLSRREVVRYMSAKRI